MNDNKDKGGIYSLTGRAGAALLLAAVYGLAARLPAPAADWPMFRGNEGRTGYAAEQAAPPLVKKWEVTGAGEIMSSPAVAGGMVYFGSRDRKIRALSAASGAPIWAFETLGAVDSSPAVYGGAVYAASMDGYLYALDRLTGALLWRAPLGGASISSPLVTDGKVFVGVGSPGNKLRIFDAANGGLLGERDAGQPVDSAPSADAAAVYFGANDGVLYSIARGSLAHRWSYQTMGGRYGYGAVAVSSSMVYALPGFDENKPLVFDPATGAVLNQLTGPFVQSNSWKQTGSPALSGSNLFFPGGAVAVSLYGLSAWPESQALNYVWASTPSLGAISPMGLLSSPALANNFLYEGTIDGSLVIHSTAGVPLSAGAADVTFSGPVYASPAVANGHIYVASAGGEVAAYRATYAAAISSPAPGAVVNGTVGISAWMYDNPVSGYTLEYGEGEAPVSWTAIIPTLTSFPAEGATVGEWNTAGLTNGVYTLKLSVLPSAGNTALLTVRVNAVPAPPSGLLASDAPADAGNRILLSWDSAPGSPAAYRVYRDAGAGFVLLASTGLSQAYTDQFAVTGTTYYYAVRAWDGYLESENSVAVQAFSINDSGDFAEPAKITDLLAVPGAAGGSLRLTWTAPGNDGDLGTAAQYFVRCSTFSEYGWDVFDGPLLTGATIPVEGPAGDNQALNLGGLFGGTTYYCRVKTSDFALNVSTYSNLSSACATVDLVAPLPPAALAVADKPADDGDSLNLSWTLSPDDGAGAGDVYGYRIYRKTQNGAYSQTPYAYTGPGVGFYTDAAASENVGFYYYVSAFDSSGESAPSPEASGVSASNWRFFDSSQGGSLRLADGARLDIPAGAAVQNDSVIITRVDPVTRQPLFSARADTRANPTDVVYQVVFKSGATSLARNAVLTLPYTDAEAAGMAQENLRIYHLSGAAWLLLNSSRVDPAAKKVSAEVGEFSFFRIMEYLPSGGVLNAAEVYTYPNPARGDLVTFKFKLAYKSDVTVDVYNVAGEKVARLERADCPAGAASEIAWRTSGIASGVYVYRLEARSAAGNKTIEKKFAVIH